MRSRTQEPRVRRRGKWIMATALTLSILTAMGMEAIARFGLGLGDPPLSIADPEIEYLFRPSATYRRFGNTIAYNQWSIRSDYFPKRKSTPSELRILILGDSVINGGAQTDQAELATEILAQRLRAHFRRPVIVANVSAGSWGPANLLAYVRRHGLFDADAVVLILSSHDYADAPTFQPIVGIDPNFPDTKPVLALQELVTRYLPRYMPSFTTGGSAPAAPVDPADLTQRIAITDQAIRELVSLAAADGQPVIAALHANTSELQGSFEPGHHHLKSLLNEMSIQPLNLALTFQKAIDAGQSPYRDPIHPSAVGQAVIANALYPEILRVLPPQNE